jgi:hypothetical protein
VFPVFGVCPVFQCLEMVRFTLGVILTTHGRHFTLEYYTVVCETRISLSWRDYEMIRT